MGTRFVAALNDADAAKLLDDLKNDSHLELVSYGDRAVSLQLPDSPSPHAVNLEAAIEGGRLVLDFAMGAPEAQKVRERLGARAAARGIDLHFEEEPKK